MSTPMRSGRRLFLTVAAILLSLNVSGGSAELTRVPVGPEPRLLFDWSASRWLAPAIEGQGRFEDKSIIYHTLLVAASQTEDPAGSWNVYRFAVDSLSSAPTFELTPSASAPSAGKS